MEIGKTYFYINKNGEIASGVYQGSSVDNDTGFTYYNVGKDDFRQMPQLFDNPISAAKALNALIIEKHESAIYEIDAAILALQTNRQCLAMQVETLRKYNES